MTAHVIGPPWIAIDGEGFLDSPVFFLFEFVSQRDELGTTGESVNGRELV